MSVKKSVNLIGYPGVLENGYLRGGAWEPGFYKRQINGTYPPTVSAVMYSRATGVHFIIDGDGRLWTSEYGSQYTPHENFCRNKAFLVDAYFYDEVTPIVVSGDKAFTYEYGKFTEIDLPYRYSCGIMHCGRLFGADECTLTWSSPDDYFDGELSLDKSGYAELDHARGEVLSLVVYKGKLIAVRKRGLTVISAYESPEKFSVDFTDTDCDDIIDNTAQVVGGKLFFYTASGLKVFDGTKISAYETSHALEIPGFSATDGQYYYVSGYSEEIDDDGILCVNASNGESCITREFAGHVYFKSTLQYISGDEHGQFIGTGTFCFNSGAINFGTDKPKTVTEIKVTGSARICVDNGRFKRKFTITDGIVRPRLRGRQFKITVESESRVSELTVTAEVADGI